MRWQFITPGAPHQNGCAEALVKGAKKALKKAIGEQVLTPFELYTCLLEVANLMNQRPIGRILMTRMTARICVPTTCSLDEPPQWCHTDRSEKPGTHGIESNSYRR